MAKENINKAILLGHIASDINLRSQAEGQCFATFLLITNKSYKSRETDEWNSKAERHSCTVNSRIAESVHKKYEKGDYVYIEGEITYQEKNGKSYTNIAVYKINLQEKARKKAEERAESQLSNQDNANSFDDDLPF